MKNEQAEAGLKEALAECLKAVAAGDGATLKKRWDPDSPFAESKPEALMAQTQQMAVRGISLAGEGQWGNVEVESQDGRRAEYCFRKQGDRWLLYSRREFRGRLQGLAAPSGKHSFGQFPNQARTPLRRKPSLWLDDAHTAKDPASPGEYARAVLKWQRFVLAEPMLEAAIIGANLMSRCVAEPLRHLMAESPGQTFENVAAFVQNNIDQHPRGFSNLSEPFGQVQLHPVTPCVNADEASAMAARFGRAFLPCVAIQYFNVAALLLSGQFSADDMIGVRLSAGSVRHEGLCVKVDGRHYFCTNTEFLHMDEDFYRVNQVMGLFGDRKYRGEKGRYTIDDKQLSRIESGLLKRISGEFQISPALANARPKDSIPLSEELVIPPASNSDLVYEGIRAQVFRLSTDVPDSHWTYAKYASQELNVYRPEAYATASAMGPLCKRRAKEVGKPGQVLAWIHKHITTAPLFPEPDRVQYGDQVLVYERGTPRDKALLAYGMMTALGVQSWLAFGTSGAYLVLSDGGKLRIHDVEQATELKQLPERPMMVFSDRECWFPAVGRFEVAPAVLEQLGLNLKA